MYIIFLAKASRVAKDLVYSIDGRHHIRKGNEIMQGICFLLAHPLDGRVRVGTFSGYHTFAFDE